MIRFSICAVATVSMGLTLGAGTPARHVLAAAAATVQVVKHTAQTMRFPGDPGESAAPRVNRPFFDQAGQLRWADGLVHGEATGSCDTQPPQQNANGYPIYPRQTRLFAPRVDERLCSRAGAPTEIALVGIDNDGKKSWERQTTFHSGSHRIDQRLIGASADGLVLSSLEVWSPKSGETLVPAATRAIPSEARAVPQHTYWGAALYHPLGKRIYVFEAEVTLTTRQGGLYEINPANGSKILIHPVATTWLRGFDRIEAMAVTPDGRYLMLAQRLSFRGPTDVSLALLDLSTRRIVWHDRFCQRGNEICADPQVVVSPKGAIGFSYGNLNRREHQLVFYELNGL